MAAYEPQPGTYAAKAVAMLRRMDAGEVAQAVLAEEIGLDDPHSLTSFLAPALAHGLVKRRKFGRSNFWSLGDGTEQRAAPDDLGDGRPVVVNVPAAGTTMPFPPIPLFTGEVPAKVQPAPAAAKLPFDVLFSHITGRMVLEGVEAIGGDGHVVLNAEQVKHVRRALGGQS